MNATLDQILKDAIEPAMGLLLARMDTPEARVMLLAIGLQESRFTHRWQVLADGTKGPARGFWQFERGTRESRGGVWGVMLHEATRGWLSGLCVERGVPFNVNAIWAAIENDDVLAAGLARLLLFSDVHALPQVGDVDGGWDLYLRTWRPGKPHRDSWPMLHAMARAEVAP